MLNNLVEESVLQRSIINSTGIAALITDENENIVWANPFFCQLLKYEFSALVDMSASTLFDLNEFDSSTQQIRIQTKCSDGTDIWLSCIQSNEETHDNKKVCVRCFIDISDLQRRQNIRLAVSSGIETSRMDPETGVLNRRTIIQELNTEISRSRRYENPLSVILLQYSTSSALTANDERHQGQTLANMINSTLRWVDLVGSLGKGCFLIVLPESDIEGAEQAWKKIAQELDTLFDKNHYQFSYLDWQKDNNADEFITRLQSKLRISKVA